MTPLKTLFRTPPSSSRQRKKAAKAAASPAAAAAAPAATDTTTSTAQLVKRKGSGHSIESSSGTGSSCHNRTVTACSSSPAAAIGLSIDADTPEMLPEPPPPTKNGTSASALKSAASTNGVIGDDTDDCEHDDEQPIIRLRPRPESANEISSGKNSKNKQEQLEDRVQDLELKLAVLSRLLQGQQQQRQQTSSTPHTTNTSDERCVSPVPVRLSPRPFRVKTTAASTTSPLLSSIKTRVSTSVATPHLESPAPGMVFARMQEDEEDAFGAALINRNSGGSILRLPLDDSLLMEKGSLPSPPAAVAAAATSSGRSEHSANKKNGNRKDDATTAREDDAASDGENDTEPRPNLQKNLSLTLLFEGDEEAYEHRNSSAPAGQASMTHMERQWLGPKILAFQTESEPDTTATTTATTAAAVQKGVNHNSNNECLASVTFQADSANGGERAQPSSPPCKQQQQTTTSNDAVRKNRSGSITDDVNVMKKRVRTKWLEYLNSFQESTPDVDVQMEEFIKVPAAVENIMGFGFFICVDSFLYMCSFLPVRFVWNCLLLCIKLFHGRRQPHNPHFQFHRRHLYQLIQVLILLLVYHYVLAPISMGKLYHWIRGQAMIKLYVIIAMVEIFDRLFSSLGQDCLDSMYWNTVSRPGSSRFLVSVFVVIVYAAIHALILFVHVATLNVAMNSADQALLTLLISGNFAEIKSTVFKKYNKAALFKITASDICERFKLALFLGLVLLLNICQGMDQKQFLGYMRICGLVWCAELLADWIKHSFITKFNFLPARVYPEYALLLAGDVTGIGHEGVNLDHSHAVVKRIGFAQTPLLCVMFRLLKEAAKYARNAQTFPNSLHWRLLRPFTASRTLFVIACVSVWALLLILKVCLGRLLQRISLAKLYAAPEYSQLTPLHTKKKKKAQ